MSPGQTPVRLNPNGGGEVVWAQRIDLARARLNSILFPVSGFRFGDIVLHDGAATSPRPYDGRDYPVFNVLVRLEHGPYPTIAVDI